jgi:hypothetical protein
VEIEVNYKEEIIKASSRIPDSVTQGSVQQSIRWKEQAMQALRVANNPKASEYELCTAYNSLKRYG